MAATAVAVALLGVAGCTSAPTPGASPSAANPSIPPPAGSSLASAEADALTIDITIAGGQVTPNGRKITAHVGQQVVLNVTSDADDEIHAHTGGDGYELEVAAGKPSSGQFVLDSPGSFEVESHHLSKIIVILIVS